MFKILVSDKLSEQGLAILRECKDFQLDMKTGLKPDELKAIISDYDALLVRSSTKATKDIIDAGTNLKVIGRAGVGLDNVDIEAATNKGIVVMNSPSGNTVSTAEHTMAMMLALSRNIGPADKSMKAGEWNRSKFQGAEVYNKVLGIIGFGRIGQSVAKRAMSFGMRVIASDPFLTHEVAQKNGVEMVELDKLFAEADYITCHVPLTPETENLISKKQIALMKKTVRIINCSRGGVVNEADAAEALREGRVAGVALDVYSKEPPEGLALAQCDNVLLTPHLGASTAEAQVNVAVEIAEQVRDALLGVGYRNAANFPSVDSETYRALQPMFNLAEKIGLLMGQLIEGRIERVDISYHGETAAFDITPLTMCLLKGLLTPILQDTVNFVNSLTLTRERSIQVSEEKTTTLDDFTNLISLVVTTEKGKQQRVAGSLFARKYPRIVRINEFFVEAMPKGNMLVIHNIDQSGLIGSLGTLLGKHHVNIAWMSFGRLKKGGRAITVLNVDSPISPELLKSIKKLNNVKTVQVVNL